MAALTTSIHFTAKQLFEMCRDMYEEDLHASLLVEIMTRWPDGIRVPVHYEIGEGQKPTRH